MDLKVSSYQSFGQIMLHSNNNSSPAKKIVTGNNLPAKNNVQSCAGYVGWALITLLALGSITYYGIKEIISKIQNKPQTEIPAVSHTNPVLNKEDAIN